MYRIQTMNKISPVGLNRFPSELYEVGDAVQDPQGILVRSAKLLDLEFNPGLLAIARAGVGVNGIGGAAVVELQMVKVVGVFPVAGKRQAPHAVPLPLQMMCAQVVGVWLGVGAGGKQFHRDGRRRGGPQLKGGSRRRVVGTQVGAVIVRQFTSLLPIHVQSLLKIVQDVFIIPDSPPVRNRFRVKALAFCRVLGGLAVESRKHFCSYKVLPYTL